MNNLWTRMVRMMQGRADKNVWKKRALRAVVLFAFFLVFVLAEGRAAVEIGEISHETAAPPQEQYAWVEIETFAIPDHLGDIIERFNGDFDKVVVHIQDANQDQSVQYRISDIIGYLNKEYGIRAINLEGGVGDYDLRAFMAITGEAIRREVARYFLKKGEINGAELYAITNPDRVLLWGIEDKELYQACLDVYRGSLRYRDEAQKYLDELARIMDKLKKRIFTPEISEMDKAYSEYKTGGTGLREYMKFLVAKAKKYGIEAAGEFPNLYHLSQALETEEKIDFDEADIERDKLMDELKKTMSKDEARQLVNMTVDFKTKRITRKDFYGFLLTKAREHGLDAKRFPMLLDYMIYIADYEAADHVMAMKELGLLEDRVMEKSYLNETQRKLSRLSRDLLLMKNLFALRMSKADYRYYREHKGSFEVRNFVDFINMEAPKYDIKDRPDKDIYKLDEYREDIARFYEYSFKRNELFLKNMRFDEKRGDKETAILITGSIHTENLCDLMENEDMSYVSISPKLARVIGFKGGYSELFISYITCIPDGGAMAGERVDVDNADSD